MEIVHSVFLDGDDTLWKTQCLYDEVKRRYVALLEQNGIYEEYTIAQLDELDAQRVALEGFTIERFVESMLILYRALSRKHGLSSDDQEVEAQICKLADYLKQPPQLYDDALPTLRTLASQARLFLVSVGETDLQASKIHATNIRHYFEQVYIVPFKNNKVLTQILEQLRVEPHKAWFVGNSPRADIAPALEAGMNALLVNRGTWRYDELTGGLRIDSKCSRFFKASSLFEAVRVITEEIGGCKQ